MVKNLLRVEGLRTYFYTSKGVVKAVDDVSLDVGVEEAVGLVGESGCGKSTTAFSILRLVPPPGRVVDGRIFFEGMDLAGASEEDVRKVRGRRISIVFQDPMTYLNPVMRIRDQIAETIQTHEELGRVELRERVLEALKAVRIGDPDKVMDYYPHQLSGGMRQRVLIAMAISSKPSLIIADEPTSALDVTIQAQILDLIKKLKQELKLSLLLITHDLGVAAEICDRIYVMYAGKIAEEADVFSLYENPKHPYTQGLLRSALSIDEFREKLFTIEGTVPDLMRPPVGCRFHPRCPHVMDVCRKDDPKPLRITETQTAYCWLYG